MLIFWEIDDVTTVQTKYALEAITLKKILRPVSSFLDLPSTSKSLRVATITTLNPPQEYTDMLFYPTLVGHFLEMDCCKLQQLLGIR